MGKWELLECTIRRGSVPTPGARRLRGRAPHSQLQVIFHKRATNYRALLWKMTYEENSSYGSSPPCTHVSNDINKHMCKRNTCTNAHMCKYRGLLKAARNRDLCVRKFDTHIARTCKNYTRTLMLVCINTEGRWRQRATKISLFLSAWAHSWIARPKTLCRQKDASMYRW